MRKLYFKSWTIPLALLILVIIGFGLLINTLGFFQDDWYLIWQGYRYGPQNYIAFFKPWRPFLAAVYIFTTQLIGTSPLAWQIFGLFTRWMFVMAAWWALRLLWPRHVREVTWIAILLAIYPGFKQHFLSVVYSNVYIALAAFLFSLGAMLLAIRQPRWKWPLTILALLTAIFNLVTTEYFFGLELFRPIFLWIVLSERPRSVRERLRLVLVNWAPYLAVTAAFLIWRVFFFTSVQYGAKLVENLTTKPIVTAFNLFQTIIQDAFDASLFAWLQTVDFTKTVYPSLRLLLFNWGIVIFVAGLVAFYLLHLKIAPNPEIKDSAGQEQPSFVINRKDHFAVQAIFLGVYSTLIAGWPYWYAGLQVDLTNGFDRFTLAYMFGAAILVVGLLDLLIKAETARIVLLSLLVGTAVLFQIRNAQTYQNTHSAQAALFRDLVWRAPGLRTGTKLLINDIPIDYTGNQSVDAAFNWVYAPNKRGNNAYYRLLYLPFKLGSQDLPDLNPGPNTTNSLVAFYQPPGCVQVLDPQVHQALPRLSDAIRTAVPLSDLTQIEPAGTTAIANYRYLFGKESNFDWCYFFEKADLARQLGNWQEIVKLGDQAFQAEMHPYEKFSAELLPFIEGYGRTERWEEAVRLSEAAISDMPALQETLCETWMRILRNTPRLSSTAATPEQEDAMNRINKLLASVEYNRCELP